MNSDWVYPLDMCASAGILDYDAAADILDQPARYVGNPKFENIPQLLPEGTKLKDQPKTDEFGNPSNIVQNPSWKKWLFGAIATLGIGALAFAGFKGKLKLPNMTKVKGFLKNAGTTVLNYIKKPFVWIANKFKKTPTP